MATFLLGIAIVTVLFKMLDASAVLQILGAAWLAFVTRRLLQFREVLHGVKHISCQYYLLTPWRSFLWLVLPTIPYISPPFMLPRNDPIAWRKEYEDANSTITAVATVFSPQVTLKIADATAIKAIMADRNTFPKPLELYQSLDPYGKSLMTTGGTDWRAHRKIVAPAFSEETYNLGWNVSVAITKDWIAHLDKRLSFQARTDTACITETNFPEVSLQLALSIFTTTAFGYRIASPGQGPDIIPANHSLSLKDTLEGAASWTNMFWAVVVPKWLSWMTFGKIRKAVELKNELAAWLDEIVEERKKELKMGGERKDLLSNLVKANDEALRLDSSASGKDVTEQSDKVTGHALSPQELKGNLFIFLLAGHETTAHTLAFALGLLALYPDEQEKLYNHIIEIQPSSDAEVPYADVTRYTRALAVIYETLRLYPAVIAIPKSVSAAQDAVIPISERGPGGTGSLFIPRDTLLSIDVQALHYDPVYWPEPEAFKPDRFIETSEYKYNRDTFLPFSSGARPCIGRKFSEVEMVAILTTFCRQYKIILPHAMQGPAHESMYAKRQRVLANRSMVTLTPLNLALAFQRR